MLAEVARLQKEKAVLEAEIKNYERSDPKIIQRMEDDVKVAKGAANRWTDNLFQILQFIQNSRQGFSQADMQKAFPIYKDLDTLD